jgi:ABC-type lipoprotein export system ATPase subunit
MLDLAVLRPDVAARRREPSPATPGESAAPVLCIDGLVFRRRTLDLTLEPGAIALVEGGKRSDRLRLLGIAAGLAHAGPGRCRLGGQDCAAGSPGQWRALRRAHVGRLLSVDTLPAGMAVQGAVAMPLLVAGMPPSQALDRAAGVLAALGAVAVARRHTEALDRREQRLALLARVLVASPPLLVLEDLDEALWPEDLPRLRAALREATSVDGSAVLFSTADPRLAALADERVNMD